MSKEKERTVLEEYRGHKIQVDENGQFHSMDEEINPGDLRSVKYQIDILEEWKAAKDVKVMRIEYPYLQTFIVRKLKVRQSTGRYKIEWYHLYQFGNGREFPSVAEIWRCCGPYDEEVFRECQALFEQKKVIDDRLTKIVNEKAKNFTFSTEWEDR